jgi:hypothetical protein
MVKLLIKHVSKKKVKIEVLISKKFKSFKTSSYNLRSKKEMVKGKSLKHSIDYWNEINESIKKIIQGKVTNEEG